MKTKSTLKEKNANDFLTHTTHTHTHTVSLKNKKAITLIALVITIIVLMILAGVAINLTLGDSGIFNKAKLGKDNYKVAVNEEKTQFANLEDCIDNIKGTVKEYTKEQVVSVDNNGVVENFYVIENSGTENPKVTLLAQKAIDTSTNKQSDNPTSVKFSSTNYWNSETSYLYNLNKGANEGKYDSNITSTSAIGYAETYARNIGAESGRLLTKTEANGLSSDVLKFTRHGCWLSSAASATAVYCISGTYGTANSGYPYDAQFTVRPVITISKSLIK